MLAAGRGGAHHPAWVIWPFAAGSSLGSVTGGGAHLPESVRAAIAVPDLVPSPLGELHFFDGVPSLESVGTIYDLLDLVRGSRST